MTSELPFHTGPQKSPVVELYQRLSDRPSPRASRQGCQSPGILQEYNFLQRNSDNIWSTGQISIEKLCATPPSKCTLKVIFLEMPLQYKGPTPANRLLSSHFKIPMDFWTPMLDEASGFFSCQDIRNSRGDLEHFGSCLRFLVKEPLSTRNIDPFKNPEKPYRWHKLGFYTLWTFPTNLVVLCFDLPSSFIHSLSESLKSSATLLHLDDPFVFHPVVIEKVLNLYNTAVWSWRDEIRAIEESRPQPEIEQQPDYKSLHDLARHAIHSSEVLAVALESMTSLIQEHEVFFAENNSLSDQALVLSRNTRRTFRSQVSIFKCLHYRSKALEERLRNEINLAFNVVAQCDSHNNLRIFEATKADSEAMKTVSVLGLVFLPATFICAIFSTTFFSFSPGSSTEPQNWAVSEKFWVYWVVAIPVTVVTVLCWWLWQCSTRRRSKAMRR